MTIIGGKRKTPRKPLQRKGNLKRSPLRKQSKRAKEEMAIWSDIKKERIALMVAKFGYVKCEYCLKPMILTYPDGHHNDHDRRNNTVTNCRLLHRFCHSYVEDHNIKDVTSILDVS